MDPSRPPSELVVASSLREGLSDSLEGGGNDEQLRKLVAAYRRSDEATPIRKNG
jgi:hypothetical protein